MSNGIGAVVSALARHHGKGNGNGGGGNGGGTANTNTGATSDNATNDTSAD